MNGCVNFSNLLHSGGVNGVVHNAPLLCASFTIHDIQDSGEGVAAGRESEGWVTGSENSGVAPAAGNSS